MPHREVVARAVRAAHQPDRAAAEAEREPGLILPAVDVPVEQRRRGHEAHDESGTAAGRKTGLGPVDQEHVVQRELAGLQHVVPRGREVVRIRIDLLEQDEVIAVAAPVREQAAGRV